MLWDRVVISYVDAAAGSHAAAAFIEKLSTVYKTSGVPKGVEVFHKNENGEHIYYLSPNASKIAQTLLSDLSSEHFVRQPCQNKPNLSGFCAISL